MAKTKRTWQPKKVKRVKKHGFMKRNSTRPGKEVMKRRVAKGRKRVVIKYNGK